MDDISNFVIKKIPKIIIQKNNEPLLNPVIPTPIPILIPKKFKLINPKPTIKEKINDKFDVMPRFYSNTYYYYVVTSDNETLTYTNYEEIIKILKNNDICDNTNIVSELQDWHKQIVSVHIDKNNIKTSTEFSHDAIHYIKNLFKDDVIDDCIEEYKNNKLLVVPFVVTFNKLFGFKPDDRFLLESKYLHRLLSNCLKNNLFFFNDKYLHFMPYITYKL